MCNGHDHKPGGCLTAKNLLTVHPTDEQLLQTPILPRQRSDQAPLSRRTGKLRPKLWDLPPSLHCPIIGTCLEVHALRRLARSLGHDAGRLSDYEIHVSFVAAASGKNAFSLAAQKALDRTHAAHLRRFARARTTEQIGGNRQRLEIMLASADAVVCTTDCVSHDAYYRSKRFCKRFAKPCVLLRSSGVTTFARALETVAV